MRSEADHGHHGARVVDVVYQRESLGRDGSGRVEPVAVDVEFVFVAVVVTVVTSNGLVCLVHCTVADTGRMLVAYVSGVTTLSFDGGGGFLNFVIIAVGVISETGGVLFSPPGRPFNSRVLLAYATDF